MSSPTTGASAAVTASPSTADTGVTEKQVMEFVHSLALRFDGLERNLMQNIQGLRCAVTTMHRPKQGHRAVHLRSPGASQRASKACP